MTQHSPKAIAFRRVEGVSTALTGAAYAAGGTLASAVLVLFGLIIIAI